MRHVHLIALLFLAFAASGQSSYWEELKAPDGGAPQKITQTADGGVYAEFYDHSVYYSQDDGLHWQQIFWPSSDPDTGFAKITVGRAGTLFAERLFGNFPFYYDVYKSTDKGASWQIFSDSSRIHAVGETSTGVWYAIRDSAWSYQIAVRSTDGGLNWQSKAVLIGGTYCGYLEIDPYDNISVIDDENYPIYRQYSWDGGNNWSYGYFESDARIITAGGAVLYSSHGYLARRTPDWTEQVFIIDTTLQPDYRYVYGLMRFPDGSLYATTSQYIYKSVDDGLTWDRIQPNGGVFLFPITSPLQSGIILTDRFDAMVRSNNLGATWGFSSFGISRGIIHDLYPYKANEWLVISESGLWSTGDGGAHWDLRIESDKNPNYFAENMMVAISDTVYLVLNDSLVFTPDHGQTFFNITPPDSLSKTWRNAVGVNDQTHTILAGTRSGTARSADRGTTWQTVTDSLFLRQVLTHPSGALFAVMDSSYEASNSYFFKKFLYRSMDDGQTWVRINPQYAGTFTITPDGDIFATLNSKISRSTDLGVTWTASSRNSDHIFSNSGGHLFSIAGNNHIELSVDKGHNWQTQPSPASDSLYIFSYLGGAFDPQTRLYVSVWDYAGFGSGGRLFRTSNPTLNGAFLTGAVFKDADGDCSTNDPESPLTDWVVKADGDDTWYTITDSLGHYTMFLDTGVYFLTVEPTLDLLWQTCADSLPVQLPDILDTVQQDIPVLAIADCPYMTVEVAAPWLERCFESYVWVHYCNRGTEPADSAWVDVMLDPYLTFTDTLMNYQALGNNTFRFPLGTVNADNCGSFQFSVYTDCDSTLLGQTLCVSAHVHPDSLCIPVPNWSGAQVQVTARCEQDTALVFDVLNTGPVTSQPLDFFVIEDDVVLMQGNETYEPGQPQSFSMAANGHFRRFESQQEPGHPFSLTVAAWSEGCGGFNWLGFPNWYNLNNGIPSEDVECTEITGSFDPNDKQGFPVGYGTEHLVEPNTDIEYLIRFQNTGTAPAHKVVIRDTLRSFLDPASIRMGPASHPYTWSLDGQGFLTVTFADINLPDSNANELASHGFVSFNISQKPDLPNGTEIRNEASIYFDFNPAVRTNETVHRIGRDFIEIVPVKEPEAPVWAVHVAPNPVAETAVLTFEGLPAGEHLFRLTDAAGRMVREMRFERDTFLFKREGLSGGVYFLQISNDRGQTLGSGKVMLR
ncbi:MAG: exo-alpha-sialidase [Saprospiraceae bacterium]|nr:exo-alpha-sialidase [Saprospiraceae bacterium]